MQFNKDKILQRIQELKSIQKENKNLLVVAEELFIGALGIANLVYGNNSPQVTYLSEMRDKIANSKYNENSKYDALYLSTIGVLNNFEKEITNDFVLNLEKIISGEIYSDFLLVSKDAISNGFKDVAVVLACAALEDSLKKYGKLKSLDVDNKEMSDIINLLKSSGAISGPQLKVIQSYTKLRNKAFHAEWDNIDTPEVKSLIAFLEEFIIKNFSL